MPYLAEKQLIVHVHRHLAALVNPDCFHHPSLPVELLLSNYLRAFPICLVVLLVYIGCYTIVHAKLHHCMPAYVQTVCSSSSYSFLQHTPSHSSCRAGYLVYHSFLSIIHYPALHSHQGMSDGSVGFENRSQVCSVDGPTYIDNCF